MEATDSIRLTVSAVRQKVFEASGDGAGGAGSLAGQLFHRTAECALRDRHPAFWKVALSAELNAEEWARVLFDEALGPELTRLQSALRDSGAEVLTVWRAVQSFTRWFCGLLAQAMESGTVTYDATREQWLGAESLFRTECELTATLKEPGWTQAVVVAGRADHLIQVAPDRWCVVEFKLGAGHAESDAAQACLYHELLGGGESTAALVRFGAEPEPQQIVLAGEWIREARPKLLALVGALAGVTPAAKQTEPLDESGAHQHLWPKPAGSEEIELGKRLIHALREFKADASMAAEPLVGPSFVRFLVEPARGIEAGKIERQGANIQMRLRLAHEPMIARSAGRIAVDLQRPHREYVRFSDVRSSLGRIGAASVASSRVLAGMDFQGAIHFVDLAKDAAHLLVGGVPGSGKSEWLRSAVASLIVTNTPDALRLLLVDPKKNAFADLAESKFLWRRNSLVDSPDERIIPVLEELIEEMEGRYELFKQLKADDLSHYGMKAAALHTGSAPPRIVCVVDEYADVLMGGRRVDRDDVEQAFIRIAQKGRAAGIHLILATQRPSRQVVTGVLKANISARVALRVANRVESGVILDRSGAQHLLGNGDLLLQAGGYDAVRLQSAFLPEEERRAVFGGLRTDNPLARQNTT